MVTPLYRNRVLKTLDTSVLRRLALHHVRLEVMHEMEYPGNSIDNLFFVEVGMASMTTTFDDGSQVEVGMFGYEGIVGVSALMGTKRSLNRVYTQIEGHGYQSPVEAARLEFERGEQFHSLALSYVQAQLVQAMQSAGCNAKHGVEQRLSRWLLLCADRANSKTFKMSHEFMADMLGSRRSTVTVCAGALKDEGLIEYSRGLIHLKDVPGLEQRACECYAIIKNHLDNYLEFDSGIPAKTRS